MARWERDMERMFGNLFAGTLLDEQLRSRRSAGAREPALDMDVY
jgi:hypothetical protein